jgi:hypothetical protein
MNPECRDGKHHNCDGIGLDLETDEFGDCSCACHAKETSKGENKMSENEMVNPEVVAGETEAGEPFLLTQMPVVMRKGEGHVLVGDAYLHKYEDRTEAFITLNTEDGKLAGEFLTSNMVVALSLGGVLDPEVTAGLSKLS